MTIFPDDENGRVLRNIASRCDDLTKPRDIDFAVVFAVASSAEQFAEHFRDMGYAVSVQETEAGRDYPWDAIVVKHMVPTDEGITDFENELQLVADRWDGHGVYARTMGLGLFQPADCTLSLKDRGITARTKSRYGARFRGEPRRGE